MHVLLHASHPAPLAKAQQTTGPDVAWQVAAMHFPYGENLVSRVPTQQTTLFFIFYLLNLRVLINHNCLSLGASSAPPPVLESCRDLPGTSPGGPEPSNVRQRSSVTPLGRLFCCSSGITTGDVDALKGPPHYTDGVAHHLPTTSTHALSPLLPPPRGGASGCPGGAAFTLAEASGFGFSLGCFGETEFY